MDYTFKEFLTIPSFSDFLLEEQGLKGSDSKVKFFAIKGKPIPITKADYKRVAGGGKQIVKKSGFVIHKDNRNKQFYVKKPIKKGMTVEYDPEKHKFVYRFDLQAYKIRRRTAIKALKKSAKKRAMTMRRTMKIRRRK